MTGDPHARGYVFGPGELRTTNDPEGVSPLYVERLTLANRITKLRADISAITRADMIEIARGVLGCRWSDVGPNGRKTARAIALEIVANGNPLARYDREADHIVIRDALLEASMAGPPEA